MITDLDILQGLKCPYCEAKTTHAKDSVIYNGKTYGGYVYLCLNCDAYVGCHKPQPAVALGRLANPELRQAKILAHKSFDALWRRKMAKDNVSKSLARRFAYKWLSEQTGIDREFCHIGMFDVAECNKVIEVCKPYIK